MLLEYYLLHVSDRLLNTVIIIAVRLHVFNPVREIRMLLMLSAGFLSRRRASFVFQIGNAEEKSPTRKRALSN